MKVRAFIYLALAVAGSIYVADCATRERAATIAPARGDDVIVVCGERYHTGTRVVLWDDVGGFDGYLERCFVRPDRLLPSNPSAGCDTSERYGVRACLLDGSGDVLAMDVRTERATVRRHVDQIVVHYDAAGSSRRCFEVLHDERGLSAHFLVDVDGVIYQTLDVRERARHARAANDRSVGIEIANMGAYDTPEALMAAQRVLDERSQTRARDPSEMVIGYLQGRRLHQFPFAEAQYESLVLLTRALREALPAVQPVCPLDGDGGVCDRVLDAESQEAFAGILGHFHVSGAKVDPGPAFDWVRYLRGANGALTIDD